MSRQFKSSSHHFCTNLHVAWDKHRSCEPGGLSFSTEFCREKLDASIDLAGKKKMVSFIFLTKWEKKKTINFIRKHFYKG